MKSTILYALQIAINANIGRTKILNKVVIKLHKKKGREKKYNNTRRKKKPPSKLKHRDFAI